MKASEIICQLANKINMWGDQPVVIEVFGVEFNVDNILSVGSPLTGECKPTKIKLGFSQRKKNNGSV